MSDDSNGLIGRSLPRPNASRAVSGRGCYTDDVRVADAAHVAFLRSPYAHAAIDGIDFDAARTAPGVIACFSGADLARICRPFVTALARFPSHRSAPQFAIAVDEACWQGEAVAAIVATSRGEAEDALELVEIKWRELTAVTDTEAGLDPEAATVHSSLPDNIALDHTIATGDTEQAFATAAVIVEHEFSFGRQTGVTLEPRTIIASFNHSLGELTVHQSHQVPSQTRDVFAEQLGLDPSKVRVIVPDVGGAFGLKLHCYADEMAVVAISLLMDRPVRLTIDRLEAFISDAHAREARATGRLALDASGRLLGFDIDLVAGLGAYSMYPRTSIGEALQAVQVIGAPYRCGALRARVRGVYQNKVPSGAYRGVGQPIACAITEQLMDLGAAALGIDPAELRRLNHRQTLEPSSITEGGVVVEDLSLDTCLSTLLDKMNYAELRRQQQVLRQQGIYRGIGLSTFVEITGVGHALYGGQKVPVTALEACRLEVETSGSICCLVSATDQGQGTLTGIAQVIATELGVSFDAIHMVSGDTATVPYGGGAWASRGIALGGEAALRAARQLKANILTVAASLLQAEAEALDLVDGTIIGPHGVPNMDLGDLAAIVRFSPSTIPLTELPPFNVEDSYVPPTLPYLATNGVQAAHIELDIGTGMIKILDFWVVDDCGRIVNPMLVDEQIRGGVVQGIGAALFETCVYSPEGQLLNGTLADYLLPMASEMPDIHIAHVSTPTRESHLGAKGVGEAGTVGALGAMWTAVNDAMRPLGAQATRQPLSPDHLIECLIAAEDNAANNKGNLL